MSNTHENEPIEETTAKNLLLKELAWRALRYDQIDIRSGKGKVIEFITKSLSHDPDIDPKTYIVRGAARFTDNSGELARSTIKELNFKITLMD
jgi:hypothetical protein